MSFKDANIDGAMSLGSIQCPPSSPLREILAPGLLPGFSPLDAKLGERKVKDSQHSKKFTIYQDGIEASQPATFYPSPLPTSSADPSSPLRDTKQARELSPETIPSPENKSLPEKRKARTPLGSVAIIKVPSTGEPVTVGRSSQSCDFALSATNKLVSRAHARVWCQDGELIVVECLGWNGLSVFVPTWSDTKREYTEYTVVKNQTIYIEKVDGISLDVHGDRALIEFQEAPLLNSEATVSDWSDDEQDLSSSVQGKAGTIGQANPTQAIGLDHMYCKPESREAGYLGEVQMKGMGQHTAVGVATSPCLRNTEQEVATMAELTEETVAEKANLPDACQGTRKDSYVDGLSSQQAANLPSKETCSNKNEQIAESQLVSNEVPSDREPWSTKSSQEKTSAASDTSQSIIPKDLSQASEAVNPVDGEEQLQERHGGSSCKKGPAPPKRELEQKNKPKTKKSKKDTLARPITEETYDEIRRLVTNFVAFSRLTSVPLTAIISSSQLLESISQKDIELILEQTPSMGVIHRNGKDAMGHPLPSEYYYIAEKDDDVDRRQLVEQSKGNRGLRACRKSHKQYFYKKPK